MIHFNVAFRFAHHNLCTEEDRHVGILRELMVNNSLIFYVVIFAWIVLYGVSIVIAAAQSQESPINWKALEEDGVKAWNQEPHCSKITWRSILPYFISVVPTFFPPYHGILDTVLYILFFLILTRILVWSARKQGERYGI
jgi:hypothetical protein